FAALSQTVETICLARLLSRPAFRVSFHATELARGVDRGCAHLRIALTAVFREVRQQLPDCINMNRLDDAAPPARGPYEPCSLKFLEVKRCGCGAGSYRTRNRARW